MVVRLVFTMNNDLGICVDKLKDGFPLEYDVEFLFRKPNKDVLVISQL